VKEPEIVNSGDGALYDTQTFEFWYKAYGEDEGNDYSGD